MPDEQVSFPTGFVFNFNHDALQPPFAVLDSSDDSSRIPSTLNSTMAKHSFAQNSVPASAPTSPAVARKSDRLPPATPQRSFHRVPVRQMQSPYTPQTSLSTPYTPLSLRSVSSSNPSSLATPASATLSNRRLNLSLSLSPEVNSQMKNNKKSLADIADNWRTRANENGIKVSSSNEESQFADDEGQSMRNC